MEHRERKTRRARSEATTGGKAITCGDHIHRRQCEYNLNGKRQTIKEVLAMVEEDEP